jgi:mono/diheme cytochrome c family protein
MKSRSIYGKSYKISLGLLLVLTIPSAKPVAAQKADAASGHKIFVANCQKCHDQDGSGSTIFGKALGAADLRSASIQKKRDGDLYTLIEKGKKNMPPFDGTLSKTGINDVIAYLRELAKKQPDGKKQE